MSTPQERAKSLANKIANGSTENLSHSNITSLQQLLQQLTLNFPADNTPIREPKDQSQRPHSFHWRQC